MVNNRTEELCLCLAELCPGWLRTLFCASASFYACRAVVGVLMRRREFITLIGGATARFRRTANASRRLLERPNGCRLRAYRPRVQAGLE